MNTPLQPDSTISKPDSAASITAVSLADNVIVLKHPYTVAGKEVTQVTVREPKVADLKTASRFGGSEADHEVALLAILCGMVPENLEQMHLGDFQRVQARFRASLS